MIFSWFWGYKCLYLNLMFPCAGCQRKILSVHLNSIPHWSIIHAWQYNDKISMVSRKRSMERCRSEFSDPWARLCPPFNNEEFFFIHGVKDKETKENWVSSSTDMWPTPSKLFLTFWVIKQWVHAAWRAVSQSHKRP